MFKYLLLAFFAIGFLYFAAMIFACFVGVVGMLITTGEAMVPLAAIFAIIFIIIILKIKI